MDKIDIPNEFNIIAEYPMGILLDSKYPAKAEEFMNFVKSEKGRVILEKYGFSPADDPVLPSSTASLAEKQTAAA